MPRDNAVGVQGANNNTNVNYSSIEERSFSISNIKNSLFSKISNIFTINNTTNVNSSSIGNNSNIETEKPVKIKGPKYQC